MRDGLESGIDESDWPTTDLVGHRVRTTPQRLAVIDVSDCGRDGRVGADGNEAGNTDGDGNTPTWSYREYDRRIDHLRSGLEECRHGARIGVLMDTRPAFASLFFATMRSGATLVPLNVRETSFELAEKVERTDVTALVCEVDTESRALEIVDRSTPVYTVDEPEADRVRPLARSADGETRDRTPPKPAAIDRSTTQLIMFTSGTSGEPKGVRLTVGNLLSSATASAFRLGVSPADRWLCCLPMYHMGGLAPLLRSALYGTTVVVQREFDPEATARAITEHDITGVSLVPTMLTRLFEVGWSPPDSLRFVLLGGAPATEELLERCDRAGVPVFPTYGMTETASQIATATPADRASETRRKGTVGQPLVSVDVSVVDDDDRLVDPGELGELVVDGPVVTPGYLDGETTETAFGPRGLHTGDIGYRDEDGFLWVVNRRSDRIVTGGENVDPGEVASVLESHPDVESAAVVGLPDGEWGERVAALVVPVPVAKPDEADAEATNTPDPDALLAHCANRLAGFKRPKTIGFCDALPRTASGTVDRDAVRDRLRERGRDVSSQ